MMFVESMFERSSSFAYVDKLCTFFTSNFVYNTTCVTVHGRIYVVARLCEVTIMGFCSSTWGKWTHVTQFTTILLKAWRPPFGPSVGIFVYKLCTSIVTGKESRCCGRRLFSA